MNEQQVVVADWENIRWRLRKLYLAHGCAASPDHAMADLLRGFATPCLVHRLRTPDELHVIAARLLLHFDSKGRVDNPLLAELMDLNKTERMWVLAEARRRLDQQDKRK